MISCEPVSRTRRRILVGRVTPCAPSHGLRCFLIRFPQIFRSSGVEALIFFSFVFAAKKNSCEPAKKVITQVQIWA